MKVPVVGVAFLLQQPVPFLTASPPFMMKTLRMSLIGGLLILSSGAVGQVANVFWPQNSAGTSVPSVWVQQAISAGNGNPSAVSITQIGDRNQLTYQQQGGGNEAQFRQQGQGNRIEVGLLSSNSRFAASQIGNQNVLSLPYVQALNAEVQVVQRGDGNSLIRQGTLTVGVPMLIEQTGGMRLILTNTGQ